MPLELESAGDVKNQQQRFDGPATVVDLKTVAMKKAAMKTGAGKPISLPTRRVAMKTGAAKAALPKAAMATMAAEMKTAVGKGKQPQRESRCHADKSSSFMRHVADSLKFSASLNQNHHRSGPSNVFDPNEDNEDVIAGGDSDIESMADWFDGEQLDQQQPAKVKEAMKFEVCSQTCFNFQS